MCFQWLVPSRSTSNSFGIYKLRINSAESTTYALPRNVNRESWIVNRGREPEGEEMKEGRSEDKPVVDP
jgi:hypothetical protein